MTFESIALTEKVTERWRSDSFIHWSDMLHFFIDTQGALTPFRYGVINYLHRTVLGLSNGLLKSAIVVPVSEPGEEGSLHLHLALTIDMDWDRLDNLHDQILTKLADWSSQEWSEEEQEEYCRWIYFSLTPSSL